jgi:threonine dehydrogenase-like Zn-dependent dehydrogenase
VLVEAEWSGISLGTEMLVWRGEVDPTLALDESLRSLTGSFRYPFTYGYSLVGRVSAGELPAGLQVLAFHPHQDRAVVPLEDVVVLEGVDPILATLYPQVETALQVAHDAHPRLGDTVVVTGLGVVGLLTVLTLMEAGAEVIGCDPRADRRKLTEALGATAVTPEDALPHLQDVTRGRGADVVVEASGHPEALATSLDLVAAEGEVVVASWYGTRPVALPLGGRFHRRRLSLRATQVSTLPAELASRWDRRRRAEVAARLLARLPLQDLAPTVFPFHSAADAYAALDEGRPGMVRAVLSYP